jgi:hypothetical protein
VTPIRQRIAESGLTLVEARRARLNPYKVPFSTRAVAKACHPVVLFSRAVN